MHFRFSRVAALLASAVVLVAGARAEVVSGKVVSVADGDTITVLAPGNRQVKVRLDGIDAPESRQDYGQRAKQAASDLVFGKQVSVDIRTRDRYGRSVGVVRVGGTDVNTALVEGGWAWWYRQYAPGNTVLSRAESSARAAKRGLWASSAPVPPWEFRRGKTTATAEAPAVETSPTPAGPAEAASPVAPSAAGIFRTATGVKFHRDGCSGLRRTRIPTTLAEARSLGLQPCGLCRP
ncbi:MAG: thermonuclease family protein [Armatimonadota bacterium]